LLSETSVPVGETANRGPAAVIVIGVVSPAGFRVKSLGTTKRSPATAPVAGALSLDGEHAPKAEMP
jgi:hypothetical protein